MYSAEFCSYRKSGLAVAGPYTNDCCHAVLLDKKK